MSFKKHSFTRQLFAGVVAACTVVVTFGSFDARAATISSTIPYTFTAGTTAKASEVNANFQSLNTGLQTVNNGLPTLLGTTMMPNVGTGPVNYMTLAAGPTAQTIMTFAATVPATGTAVITSTGSVCLNASSAWLIISVDGTLRGSTLPSVSGCSSFSVTASVPALAAGTHTISLTGMMMGGAAGSTTVGDGNLTAVLYH